MFKSLANTLRFSAATAAMVIAFGAQAQVVTNGNFETPAVSADTVYDSLTSGGGAGTFPSLPGWTVSSGDSVTVINVNSPANQYLQIQEQQSVYTQLTSSFVAGSTYSFGFNYFGGNSANGQTAIGTWKIVSGSSSDPFTASAIGVSAGSSSGTLNEGGTAGSFLSFLGTFSPTVSSTNLFLVFDVASQNGGTRVLNIDNVSAVPEPQALVLALAGIGALALMRRRRNDAQR